MKVAADQIENAETCLPRISLLFWIIGGELAVNKDLVRKLHSQIGTDKRLVFSIEAVHDRIDPDHRIQFQRIELTHTSTVDVPEDRGFKKAKIESSEGKAQVVEFRALPIEKRFTRRPGR